MIGRWIKILIFTIIVILLQVWLFNGISLFRVASPYVYPIILMFLPINLSKTNSVLWAFTIGAIIDFLTFIPGLHAASFTILGFLRPYLLRSLVDEDVIIANSATWYSLKGRSFILLTEVIIINTILLFILDSLHVFDFSFFMIRLLSSICLSWIVSCIILYFFDYHHGSDS